jgi:hypothetical protein
MRADRTPLQNGLLFGLVACLFGGSLWVLIVVISGAPEESMIAPIWVVLGGGVVFCFFAGFLAGAFNAPGSVRRTASAATAKPSLVQRLLGAVGWFGYRLLVGLFVGIIATMAFCIAGITPWFYLAPLFLHLDDLPLDSPARNAMESSAMAALFCGFSGGMFGALLVTRRSSSDRTALSSRAIRSSFLSFLFGIPFGVSLGWLPPTDTRFVVILPASVPIGILASILGGIWMDVRERRGIAPQTRLAETMGEFHIE